MKRILLLLLVIIISGGYTIAQKEMLGKIVDTEGNPLPGVNILEKGTTNGTISDLNGKYMISVSSDSAILIFSYVGFLTEEVPAGTETELNMTLLEDLIGLSEVVVVGYGSLRKKDLTGSITTINDENFNQGVTTSPAQLLQGKVPGLTITKNGDPTTTPAITLRGPSTLRTGGAQEPFYVIDGVPGASIDIVPTEDIVSIDVLRDASATAIYGSRAANGVIIVTTRRGEEGFAKVDYNAYVAFENIANQIEVLDADEYRKYNADNGEIIDDDYGVNTDWQEEVSRTGVSHNHNLSVSGGNKGTSYAGSITYLNHEGIIKTSALERFMFRANIQQKALNDRLELGFDVATSINDQDKVRGDVFRNMLRYQPTVPVKNEDGSFFQNYTKSEGTSYYNPVSLLYNDLEQKRNKTLLGTFSGKVNIIEGLDFKFNISYQNRQREKSVYHSKNSALIDFRNANGYAESSSYEDEKRVMEMYVTYEKQFGDHDLKLLGGYSWQEDRKNDGFVTYTTDFTNDELTFNNLSLGNNNDGYFINPADFETLRLISGFARVNYAYQGKYLVQASVRQDGSSAFGENDQWGMFPAFSLGWRITEEAFMQSQSIFNNLKLRLGYGVSGNSLGFPALIAVRRYGLDPNSPTFYSNGKYVKNIVVVQNPNPDLKWESTSMLNIGLDFSVLDGRVNGTLEYYNKRTEELIVNTTVSTTEYQHDRLWANIGEMKNSGFEFSINAVPVDMAGFRWSTTFNGSFNTNEITALSNSEFKSDSIQVTEVGGRGQSGEKVQIQQSGYEYGQFFLREYAGKDANGLSQFYTVDRQLTTNLGNAGYFYAGSAQPKALLGWQNSLSYNNISLDFFFRGTFGNKILNATLSSLNYPGGSNLFNVPRYTLDEGESVDDKNADINSTRFIEDGDYIRLDYITLSYKLNFDDIFIKTLKLYTTVTNVLTITDYKGIDPEVNMAGDKPGIDNNNFYPKTRSVIFGLNASF